MSRGFLVGDWSKVLRMRDLEVNSKIKNQNAKLRYPGVMIFYDDFSIMAISSGVRP